MTEVNPEYIKHFYTIAGVVFLVLWLVSINITSKFRKLCNEVIKENEELEKRNFMLDKANSDLGYELEELKGYRKAFDLLRNKIGRFTIQEYDDNWEVLDSDGNTRLTVYCMLDGALHPVYKVWQGVYGFVWNDHHGESGFTEEDEKLITDYIINGHEPIRFFESKLSLPYGTLSVSLTVVDNTMTGTYLYKGSEAFTLTIERFPDQPITASVNKPESWLDEHDLEYEHICYLAKSLIPSEETVEVIFKSNKE